MSLTIALIGNPNCGKTTLFNQLTGSNQHVGNFPGVTVEKKEGFIRKRRDLTVVDLPGIYSLSPYTAEEVVTRDYLLSGQPDCIINIIDATSIERNLYLTLQLMELSLPVVLALNMMDEIRGSGGMIDVEKLQKDLGIPVIPISASRNEGVAELIEMAAEAGAQQRKPERLDFCHGHVHTAIHSIAHLVTEEAEAAELPLRFTATKIVEGDQLVLDQLKLAPPELDIIGHIVDDMECHLQTDREAAMADMRYAYIDQLCADCVQKPAENKEHARSVRIDNVLTHKFYALPIFFGIMLLIFWFTFGVLGESLKELLSLGIGQVTDLTGNALTAAGVSPALHSLIIDGVFAGVGSVLSFLPTIVILFCFLSILEDSGYMARVAFVMDKLLRKIGLSGRSFVPMLIGFGCSVPAIMATRTLPSEQDRKMTILLTPFMSCSAKLPIYAMFTAAFFPKYGAFVMITLYILGMVIGIFYGLFLKRFFFVGEPVPFVMELPAYRFPAAKSVALHMWEKAKDFIVRAFTVIFFATIIIWVLQSFDFGFNMVADSGSSMLATMGKWIAPIFAPLGFGHWQAATALITGLTAKEAVVSTLAVLFGASDPANLASLLSQVFSPLTAFCFLVFSLLYMPCVAAMAAVRRELGSMRKALLAMLAQTAVAWLVTFVIYQVAHFLLSL